MKKFISLSLVCMVIMGITAFAKDKIFTDIEVESPYYEATTSLSKLGILKGYDDKTF